MASRDTRTMRTALRIRTTVLPGRRIEITDPALQEGDVVDVLVTERDQFAGRSALEIIGSLRGKRLFESPEAVDTYIAEQRASWDP
jgi:hypothetical protein